jgi:hypothetical protein
MSSESAEPRSNGTTKSAGAEPSPETAVAGSPAETTLRHWLRGQSVNVARHAEALRPFRREEFGTEPEIPSEGHIAAVNRLMDSLRRRLQARAGGVARAVDLAIRSPRSRNLQVVVRRKESAHNWVGRVERIWDFYFELFGQRQSEVGGWLLGCDRIALDCYQAAFLNVGQAKSIPAPPPLSYMRTGFSPATFRRGIPLRRLGRQLNPFPLVQLPYHRLVNPWTLGAVLHEVSHNLHNELGLARAVPLRIGRRLLAAGVPRSVVMVWVRWNRETFADLSGLLLGGPAVVGSLMDVVGRSPEAVLAYDPRGPHPTPYLRVLLSIELLRRMGFADLAKQYRRAWTRIYPDPRAGTIPSALLTDFPATMARVVDAVCYRPFPQLGNKALSEVLQFSPKEQQIVEEAGQRLAAGIDPGVVPERFLIGASRLAFERRMASPETITRNFYNQLARR